MAELFAHYLAYPAATTGSGFKSASRQTRTQAYYRTLPVAAEVVVQEAIDHFYLQREKPRLSDLLKEVEQECLRKGLRVPNYRTVKRRVDAIDARESVRKRSGSKAANDRFRPTGVLSSADLLPLERVQIDHTLVDVVIVDEGDRLPIGRPWLTLAIDVASRAVLGFSVWLDEPSTASVALALVQAVLTNVSPPARKTTLVVEASCYVLMLRAEPLFCDGFESNSLTPLYRAGYR